MSLFRAKAVVLKSRNLGEADRILTLLAEGRGKFEASVKGARRQRSRFVGNTLPFSYIEALFLSGRGMDSLSQAEILHSFTKLREELEKLACASLWMELVDGFLPEKQEADEVFRFLLAALIALETSGDPEALHYAFEMRLLNYLGYQPELNQCVNCGALPEEKYGFSIAVGGLVCGGCRGDFEDWLSLRSEELELLNKLGKIDVRKVAELKLISAQRQFCRRLLRRYTEYRLDRPLKAHEFWESVFS
jgi:DNA repair protein RecO (recombination protein O)